MEVKNDLVGYQNLKIYQDTNMFNFSLDSVLLPNFITLNKNVTNILDIGTGNAPMPLILSTKTNAKIIGVEIQKEACILAQKSIKANNLYNQIKILNDDINNLYKKYSSEFFDTIICNPPYFKALENSNYNKSDYKTIARHEVKLNLKQIFLIAKKLLKTGGNIALVHRPERLIEIIMLMKENGIEPKKIRYVYPKKEKEANMVLVEGIKNGKPGLKVMYPLISHNEDGSYTEEITKYFEGR